MPGARGRHPDTIKGAIHVFMGDDDDFIARGPAGRPSRLQTFAHLGPRPRPTILAEVDTNV